MSEVTKTEVIVEPFKATVELAIDGWQKDGTVYKYEAEVPGLRENGITKAYPDEEEMKEKNIYRSWTMKTLNIIFEGETLEVKSLNDMLVAYWIDNYPPKSIIILDIEQLPFD